MKLKNNLSLLKKDYKCCLNIIKKNSRSFYLAFKDLPFSKRYAVFVIYTFCRFVDDLIDEPHATHQFPNLLDMWEDFKQGSDANNFLFRGLRWVFNTYAMEFYPFDELIAGIQEDINAPKIKMETHLIKYCYSVASTVGLMLLPILAIQNHKEVEFEKKTISLGHAMQLTNILRDIGEDLDRDRCYLPLSKLNEIQINFDILKTKNQTLLKSLGFEKVCYYYANMAYQKYDENLSLLWYYDKDSRKAISKSIFLYRAILKKIEKNPLKSLNSRTVISKFTVLKTIFQSNLYCYQVNLKY